MRSPEPSPRIERPRARWSTVSDSCASIAGWRWIVSVTQTPTRIRSVAAPAAPIMISGSKKRCGFDWYFASSVMSSVHTASGTQPMRCQGHQIASKPSASACWANSMAFEAGGMMRPGAPSVTRIRPYPTERPFDWQAEADSVTQHHQGLMVEDLERAIRFYTEAFDGMPLTRPVVLEGGAAEMVMDAPPGARYSMCLIRIGAATVELFSFHGDLRPAWARAPKGRLPHFGLQVDDVEAALERIERAGGAGSSSGWSAGAARVSSTPRIPTEHDRAARRAGRGHSRGGDPNVPRRGATSPNQSLGRRSARKTLESGAMLAYRTDGPIGWATLDRPDKLNAMTRGFWQELPRRSRPGGAGRQGPRPRLPRRRPLLLGGRRHRGIRRAVRRRRQARLPAGGDRRDARRRRVARSRRSRRCTATRSGGGCELTIVCDIVVADETARFGTPEAQVGLVPGPGRGARGWRT